MELNETTISKAIIDRYFSKLTQSLESDVVIVGGGPSGLVCGYFLAKQGKKVILFERKLSIGGGMWGGGMMFNEIVVQESALYLLEEFGIGYQKFQENYYTADSIEAISTLTSQSIRAGLTIFNCISGEDVLIRDRRVIGLVINWSPVEIGGLHVDPLSVCSKFVVDATGHSIEIVKMVQKKVAGKLNTASGQIEGEKAMWAEKAEKMTLENTREVFPGLYVTGMAANATFGGPRMGPIFGGMLLSGEKLAKLILDR